MAIHIHLPALLKKKVTKDSTETKYVLRQDLVIDLNRFSKEEFNDSLRIDSASLYNEKEAAKLDAEIKSIRLQISKADSSSYPKLNSKLAELLKKRNHYLDSVKDANKPISKAQLLKEIAEVENMLDDAKVDRNTQEVNRLKVLLDEFTKELKSAKDSQQYPTLYKTAEVKSSGRFYKVIASSKPTKEETDKSGSLLLLIDDGSKQWQPINNLSAVL